MSTVCDYVQAKEPAQRKRRRWLLAIAALVLLFAMPPAGLWWFSRDGLKDDVLAVGGRYKSITDTGFAVGLRYLTRGEVPRMFHRIDLGKSRADDAWLEDHAEGLKRSNQLVMFLRDSRITAQGLAALSNVPNLVYLDLSGTRLEDPAVGTLTRFPKLVSAWIPRTGIKDTALAGFAGAPHLSFLVVDADQATEAGIAGLKTCPHLNSLWVMDADNECVARLLNLERLTSLHLQGPQIDGQSLTVLKQMQKLQSLTLIDTQFSDAELDDLRQARPGCTVTQAKLSEFDAKREAAWNAFQ